MRSIRLSLVVYVLALLAVALGAVSLLVFHTVHQTLLAKKAASKDLLEAQYKERRDKENLKQRLKLLLDRLYGPRTERSNPDQLLLFADWAGAQDCCRCRQG